MIHLAFFDIQTKAQKNQEYHFCQRTDRITKQLFQTFFILKNEIFKTKN